MKRFFFHIYDGHRWFKDALGEVVPKTQSVTDLAYTHIRDIRISQAEEVEWGRWLLSVTDEEGCETLRVTFNFEVVGGDV